MKTLAILATLATTAYAIPAPVVAGAAPPQQNYCQLDIKLSENLPRIDFDPRARVKLNIWDKEKYMDEPLHYPKWINKDLWNLPQVIGPGDKYQLALLGLTVGNNTLQISWEATGDIASDYLYFVYKGSDGKLWTQFKDTDENRSDTYFNYVTATSTWLDASVKTHCERTNWEEEDKYTRVRYVVCAFKC